MTWKDVTTSDIFREAPPDERAEYKKQYFSKYAVPMLREDGLTDDEIQITAQEFFASVDDTGEGAIRSATSAFARGALRPLSDIPIAVGALTGSEGIEDFGKDIQGGIESAFPVNPAQEGFFTTEVPGVAGQVGSMLLGGGTGALAGRALAGSTAAAKLGAKAAVGTQAFTGGASGGAQRADELGLEGGQKQLRALLGGGTELAAEALPFGMALETGAVRKLLGETIEGGWMSPVIKGTATEAVEEGIAETAGQATDIAFAPEQANMDLQQIGKAMLLGGVGGAMFGGVNAAIAPKTAEAFKYEGEFVRVRDINEAPAEVQQQFAVGDTSRLVLDKRGKVIGYKPAAETIEADMPTEIIVPENVSENVPEVTQMVEGLTQNPTVPQVSKALAEDFGSGAPPMAPQPNLLTGAPRAASPSTQTSPIDSIQQAKSTLDQKAQALGFGNIRAFNAQNQAKQSLTAEQQALLDEYANLQSQIRGLKYTEAANLSDEDFSAWQKTRFNPDISNENDLVGMSQLLMALQQRGDTQNANRVRESILQKRRKTDWTIQSWADRFGNEDLPSQDEIDATNADAQSWNEQIDGFLEIAVSQGQPTSAPADQFIQAYSGDALPQPDMQANLLTGVPTNSDPIARMVNASKSQSVYGEDGEIDRKATQEKLKAEADAIGITVDELGARKAAEVNASKQAFWDSLNDGDVITWETPDGQIKTATVEVYKSGAKYVVSEGGYEYQPMTGEFLMNSGTLKVTPASTETTKPTQTITGSNVQTGTEMPVLDESPVTSPGVASLSQEAIIDADDPFTQGLPLKSNDAYEAHWIKHVGSLTRASKEQVAAMNSEPYAIGEDFGLPVYTGSGPAGKPDNALYEENGAIYSRFPYKGNVISLMIGRDNSVHFSSGGSLGSTTGKGAFATMNAIMPKLRQLIEIHAKSKPRSVYRFDANDARKIPLFSRYAERSGFDVSGNTFKLPEQQTTQAPLTDETTATTDDMAAVAEAAEEAPAPARGETEVSGVSEEAAGVADDIVENIVADEAAAGMVEPMREEDTQEQPDRLMDIPSTMQFLYQQNLSKTDTENVKKLLEKNEKEARKQGRIQGARSFYESDVNNAIEEVMAKKQDSADFRKKLENAKKNKDFSQELSSLIDSLAVEEASLRSIQSEKGMFGVQWAERNVRTRETNKKKEIRALKERIVAISPSDIALKAKKAEQQVSATADVPTDSLESQLAQESPEISGTSPTPDSLPATGQLTPGGVGAGVAAQRDTSGQVVSQDGQNVSFGVDEQLLMRSPFTNEDSDVSFRGVMPDGKAVVWTGKTQMAVPLEWLRRAGEPLPISEVKAGGADISAIAQESQPESSVTAPTDRQQPLPLPKTKDGLIAELIGPIKDDYVARQAQQKTINNYKKFSKDELLEMVKDQRIQDAKFKRRQEVTSEIIQKIKEPVNDAGAGWVKSIKEIAKANGIEDYSILQGNSRGEEIYRIAARIADRGDAFVNPFTESNATPAPQAQPPAATTATQETQQEAAAPPSVTATEESTAAEPAAVEADVAAPISDSAPTEGPSNAAATDVGGVESQASQRLRDYIATATGKAKEVWTPERLAIADEFYRTGDRSLLDPLPKTLRTRVYEARNTEESNAAYVAKQKRAFELRNPPPVTESEFLAAPNALLDSQTEEQLQQERARRKEAPAPEGESVLRAADGVVLRTGVESIDAEAARNSYDGVIPGVEQTWVGTTADFAEQFPDGYPLGDNKTFPESYHEALVAPDGRAFIFTDQVEILEGDVARAREYGTTPGVEAVKRTLRHESFAHRGFMALPHPLKRRFMDLIESGVIPQAELDYLVTERGYSNLADWRDNISTRQMAAEEWLAHKLERMTELPKSGPVAEFLDWLRDVWDYLTGGAKPDDAVIRDTLRAMHKALGSLEPGQRIIDEQVRASYIGERAIENMPEERKQFMRDSLDTAKAMAAAGKSSEEIRAVTGWFPGPYDGKMRWELPDDGARLINATVGWNPLQNWIEHTELFRAYPEASDIPIRLDSSLSSGGVFAPNGIRIHPNASDGVLNTLLHEIQHWIQNKEGFAFGSSPIIERSKIASNEAVSEAVRGLRLWWNRSVPPSRRVEVKEQLRNRVGSGQLDTLGMDIADESALEKLETWEFATQFMNDGEKAAIQPLIKAIYDAREAAFGEAGDQPAAQTAYLRSAGEIEARDVQARQNLTPEQRRATAPFSSENIAPEDAIVMFGSGGVARASNQQMTQQDRDYMAAVEAGDMEAAQRIVDEAARAAGFKQMWHFGTDLNLDPKRGAFYTTSQEAAAKSWGEGRGDIGKLYRVFIQSLKPAVEGQNILSSSFMTPELSGLLKERGFDSAIGGRDWKRGDELAVFSQNQIKSADPITRDDSGNIIPPSQRFNPATSDIRASRQSDPINNNPSFSSASVPKTTAPRNPNRMLSEIQISADGIRRIIPKKYLPFAEKFGFQKALKQWAKDLMQPYTGSIQDLRRLLMVIRDPAKTQAVLGITPQDGSSIIPSILELAALKADKLGNTTLGDVFRSERQKVGSQAGQNLAAIKAANLDKEFSPNRIGSMIQGIQQDDQKSRVDKDINPKNVIPEVEATLEAANDGASSNVEDGVNDETMISMRILELGVAAEDDSWLRGKLEELVAAIIDYGEAAAETDVRASIADKRVASKAAPADRMAAAAETIKRINREINEHLKKKTKKATPVDGEKSKQPKAAKEPKPIQTAKQIIDSIAKKVTGQQKAKPEPNKVRQLYKQQLKQPKVEAEFLKEALALGVDAVTAKKLFDSINLEIVAVSIGEDVAEGITAYNEAIAKRLRFMDVDSRALANFVNNLRREGKLTGEPIRWKEILSLPVTDQFTIKETMLERIKADEAFKDLSDTEQQALVDALESVWQKERAKLFKQMVKRAERKGMTKDAKQRIEDATPKLLEYINQGMLASDAFYAAVGEQYGWQPVSKEDRLKLEKLAAEMQEPGISSMERNMKQEEIVRVLQRNTRLSRAEVLSSFWVLSVLTGGRTQFDMALGVLSGALSILKKAVAVATTGKDPKLALKGLSDFGKFMVIAGEQSYNYVMKGESGIILNRRAALNDSFAKDKLSNVLPTGDKLMLLQDKPGDSEWQLTKNKLARGLGKFMGFWERLMAGWDHITASATYHGTMRLASGLNPKLFDAALVPNDADWENAMAMAKLRRPGASRAQTTALAQSLLIDGVRSLGRDIEESRMDQWRNMVAQAMAEGSTASYQETPTGFGGVVYGAVRRITEGTEEGAKWWSEKQKATYFENMGPINAIFKHLGELGYIIATQAQNILGVRFMRFTGNKLNELISYVPVLGLGRLREEGMMDDGEYTLRGRNVYHNQALGWTALTLYIYMMTRLDEPDEEKKVIVEGSWENLTPERKSQLMAAGRKPNTVRIKTSDGKELSFNYVSWPFAGWLAGFGSLSDVKRYTPDKWTEKTVADKTMSAAYAGAFAISDISSLSSLSELFGRSTYSTDPTEAFVKRISKAGSNYVGGFMPKFVKDIDSWFDDSAYRPENTWQHLAAQMPLLRRSAGAPVRDIFYEPVNVSRAPWSRAIQMSPDEQEYMLLGRLNSRGIWLTPPNADNRKVKSRTGRSRDMTEEEAVKYMQLTGEGYKQMLQQHGERLLSMDTDAAARLVEKYAARVRERALKKAVARGAATVTVEAL
jgi:hypothetical protein